MGKKHEQNHYNALGVDPDADANEIRHAYRTAARKHHPDAATGDSDAFRRVQEAYEVLSDKKQRLEYDRSRGRAGSHPDFRRSSVPDGAAVRPQEYAHPGHTNHPFGRSVVDELMEGFPRGFPRGPRAYGNELAIDLILSPAEAMRGGSIPVEVPVTTGCPVCGGWGCAVCSGSGEIETVKRISIDIPAGVRNGVEERFSLEGIGLPGAALHVSIIVGSP